MKCKKILDGRKLPREAKEQVRIAAVRRIEAGESPEAVASGMGLNRRTIYRWLESFHYGGEAALQAKPIPGAPAKLSAEQMEQLSAIIRTENPLQLKFPYALWTLAMIRELIRERFSVALSEVSVGRLMRRLGFSAQRPLYRASQQDAVLVERWQAEVYPQLVARAKKENALIFFADEAGMRSDHHAGTTWSPVGNTPVVSATGSRFSCNMISAVNALGHFRFMTVEGTVNATVFREFLRRLITGMDRKIHLVVDGHPSHRAKWVKEFVEQNADRIELHFLPPYSPQLNPDELVWAHIKSKVAKATVTGKEDLKLKLRHALRKLQRMPDIVASFFSTPSCAYAKA